MQDVLQKGIDKTKIIQGLQKEHYTLEMAKMLGHDHRTFKKYMLKIQNQAMEEQTKEKIRGKTGVTPRVIRLIKSEVHHNSLQTIK